ncbi:DUF1499 domain-containing protein [Emcibacter sp.]|uniref:DUF1499 domain-containing protein n=1 Tax=Emcibacter sp. TaxID=1979954 RepID=UPI003A92DDB7
MIIGTRKKSLLARVVFYLAVLQLFALLLFAGSIRLDILSPLEAFALTLRTALYGGIVLTILSLLVLIPVSRNKKVRGTAQVLLTLLIGIGLAGPVLYLQRTGGNVPPIHDITTDMENPPLFTVLQKERTERDNSLDYEGEPVANLQRAAYPHIQPLITTMPADQAYALALQCARDLDWRIALEDESTGRIEATDRTMWFRFIDDVVIMVSPEENGSRIDLRSVSRIGRSDLGANARRIAAFMALFDKKAAQPAS